MIQFKIIRLNQGSQLPYYFVCEQLNNVLLSLTTGKIMESKTILIPVCYGEELGPDLRDSSTSKQFKNGRSH